MASKQMMGGRTTSELRLKVPGSQSSYLQTSLTIHKFNDKIIKNFKKIPQSFDSKDKVLLSLEPSAAALATSPQS